ncbi:DEAD/DEAH box helicase, partial [Actinomyces gerencseriae]|uniref:DEAD/DEAH box helicase n=1 Tax=Actinomyces gerencseriae TaxID=52769 RepID=UPI0023F05B40
MNNADNDDTAEHPEDMPLPAVAGEFDDATSTGADADAPAASRSSSGARRSGRNRRGAGRPGRRSSRRRREWSGFTPEQLAERAASVPALVYPDELPVSARRAEIAEAIRDNQVVIVAGETGSGKTTQIPKICLALGRGVTGMIGHTQPRRIAARSVAERIAHELGTPIGRNGVVGYQVRFTEETGPTTLVKLMTDGILLAEIQSDPMLSRYDTIIVDEAHERSLNIDFILGYLARLLPSRPDLKVIITSATIDSARFADHFGHAVARAPAPGDDADADSGAGRNGRRDDADADAEADLGSPAAWAPAPVIEVSGRTYPVEIRYRPLIAGDDAPDAPDARPARDPAASATPSA